MFCRKKLYYETWDRMYAYTVEHTEIERGRREGNVIDQDVRVLSIRNTERHLLRETRIHKLKLHGDNKRICTLIEGISPIMVIMVAEVVLISWTGMFFVVNP